MGDESNEFHRGSASQSNGTYLLILRITFWILRVAMEIILRILIKRRFVVAFDYSKKMIELAKRRAITICKTN